MVPSPSEVHRVRRSGASTLRCGSKRLSTRRFSVWSLSSACPRPVVVAVGRGIGYQEELPAQVEAGCAEEDRPHHRSRRQLHHGPDEADGGRDDPAPEWPEERGPDIEEAHATNLATSVYAFVQHSGTSCDLSRSASRLNDTESCASGVRHRGVTPPPRPRSPGRRPRTGARPPRSQAP